MNLIQTFLILTIGSPAFSRDLLPEHWFEDIPATNQSVQHCYVIRTVPGVVYRVESSADLVNWNVESEVYGLGQEFVTPLFEFTPPPPTPPGDPPLETPVVVTVLASIQMNPATGTTGGVVVSWASLDGGGARVFKIAGTMDPAWNQVPLYAQTYGNYVFSSGIPARHQTHLRKILFSEQRTPP